MRHNSGTTKAILPVIYCNRGFIHNKIDVDWITLSHIQQTAAETLKTSPKKIGNSLLMKAHLQLLHRVENMVSKGETAHFE